MPNSRIWKILYRDSSNTNWKELLGKPGYWYADPILFNKGEEVFLFSEAFNNKIQKGCLAVSVMKNGEFSEPNIVMKRPFHLSYPCVFDYKGKAFMIPETSQNGTLELWEGSSNLLQWNKVKNILEHVKYADTTVFVDGEKVYLFAYEEGKEFRTHIYLLDMFDFTATKLEEIIHEQNIYRPAGKFFHKNGILYRPVQYNINKYGEKILINKIISIQPFKETLCKEITATEYSKDLFGCNTHTISFAGDVCAVDYLCPANLPLYERLTIIRKIRNCLYKIKYRLGI